MTQEKRIAVDVAEKTADLQDVTGMEILALLIICVTLIIVCVMFMAYKLEMGKRGKQ